MLRRPSVRARPRVAGRVVIAAPDIGAARRDAQAQLSARADGQDGWSLGLLRPLTPRAPGTHRYEATFAQWQAEGDHFTRRDVRVIEVWAQNAATARRIAQQDIQQLPAYEPSWRIRSVRRRGGTG